MALDGYIYTSTDAGATWTQQTSAGNRDWYSIASSSDGTKLAAVASNNYIHTSTDAGATWTQQTSAGNHVWLSIASSSDGTKLAAVALNNYIHTSIDAGATWTQQTSAGNHVWRSIASSSDGTKLAAVTSNDYIYTSTDTGATWTQQTSAGNRDWHSIASSSDGTKLAAVVWNGHIYTSTDTGTTWTQQTSAGNHYWSSIASSSDGTKLAAMATQDYIYTSTDAGANWTPQTSAGNRDWYSIASSSDGARLAVVSWNDYIYTSTNTYSYNYTVNQANGSTYKDGTATVSLSGTDLAGNTSATPTNNTFTIDTTPPTIAGVTSGAYYSGSKAITFSDTHLSGATLNGVTYTNGSTISTGGTYVFLVTDLVGNTNGATFTIDTTPPTMAGVTSGAYYSGSKAITFSDTHLSGATLNGVAYTSSSTISTGGTYVFLVTDLAGNTNGATFTIDTQAPILT